MNRFNLSQIRHLMVLAASGLGLAACMVQTQPHDPNYRPPPPNQSTTVPTGLRRVEPVNCDGTQAIRLDKVLIQTDGPAITARNRCTVELIDSHIVSGEWAIRMNGETSVTLVRTQVEGAKGAVKMNDSAVLSAQRSSFVGAAERLGQSSYRDQGGNQWRSGAPTTAMPAPAPAPALQRAEPVSCDGTQAIKLERVIIETNGPAITARNRCKVEIIDSRIVSGEWAIRMNGETSVSVVRSQVEGAQGAVKMNDTAVLSSQGSQFMGALERKGQAAYQDQGGNQWRGGTVK